MEIIRGSPLAACVAPAYVHGFAYQRLGRKNLGGRGTMESSEVLPYSTYNSLIWTESTGPVTTVPARGPWRAASGQREAGGCL